MLCSPRISNWFASPALLYLVRVEQTNEHGLRAIAHLHVRMEKDSSPDGIATMHRIPLRMTWRNISRCIPELSVAAEPPPRGGTRPTKERTKTMGPVPPPGATGH